MESMANMSERIRAFADRMARLCEDPEFQRNQAKLRAEHAEALAASARAERSMRMLSAGVPKALWSALETPRDEEALCAVRDFFDTPALFLTLSGAKGRGKTFALCWAVAERGGNEGGRYLWAGDLVHAGIFDAVWKDLAECTVLAIDELGAEYMNDAYLASLYTLLDKRYANGRRTLLATNLDGPAFRTRYCSGGMERLYERLKTGGAWKALEGESMRKHWTETDGEDDA